MLAAGKFLGKRKKGGNETKKQSSDSIRHVSKVHWCTLANPQMKYFHFNFHIKRLWSYEMDFRLSTSVIWSITLYACLRPKIFWWILGSKGIRTLIFRLVPPFLSPLQKFSSSQQCEKLSENYPHMKFLLCRFMLNCTI